MKNVLLISTGILIFSLGAANADIPVSPEQRAVLETKLSEMQCSGGYMQFDPSDDHFEVNNAICDGRKFDLTFSKNYKLLEKDLED
ncbi:hypothetical protein EDF68_1256 [Ochrobactrum sp. BH3]|nr:hypothetical protein EDF68_1256 [Ochrobactrum sp. BH3]